MVKSKFSKSGLEQLESPDDFATLLYTLTNYPTLDRQYELTAILIQNLLNRFDVISQGYNNLLTFFCALEPVKDKIQA